MFLTKKLDEGVILGGRFYPVCTDFKNWLKICDILESEKMPVDMKLCRIFSLCYTELPESISEAMEGIFQFMSPCTDSHGQRGGMDSEKVFSFAEDGELIYAAFLAQYGIDLLCEDMHWHKFLALFSGLCGKHKLFDVIFARTVKLADIKDSKKRSAFARLKKMYSLKGFAESDEKDFIAAEEMASLF